MVFTDVRHITFTFDVCYSTIFLYQLPNEILFGLLTRNHANCRSQDSMSAGDRGGDEERDDEDSSGPRVVTAIDLAYPHRH